VDMTRNIDLARRLIEDGIGGGDLSVVDAIVAPGCIEHQRGLAQGAAGVREVTATLHRWMSDLQLRVVDSVEDGDVVWTRNRAEGVNTGPVMGHPATGRRVEVDVFDVVRLEDGKVVEHWGVADQLGMLLQLGVIGSRPADGPA
jgi:predicted ester cyclase